MNAKSVGLMVLLSVLAANTCYGQFNALLCDFTFVLRDSCSGGHPLPDGQIVYIYWDQDNDGPDDTDPLPQVGECFACCNFNSFLMNGEALFGQAGTFCCDPMFTISTTTPQPSRYYLRVPVCERGIRWTSSVFTITNGINEHDIVHWTCGPCPHTDITTCTASRDFDDRIELTWSDVIGEDGYEVWRSEAGHVPQYELIAQTEANEHAYTDFSCAPGREYFYRVRSVSAVYGPSDFSPVARGRRVEVEPIVFGEVIVTTNISGVMSAEAADLDADGDMDVVAAGMFANKVAWYENNGSWGFTEHELISGWRGARAVDVGDIDGDGDLDIVAVARFENSLIWWDNLPDGYWMRPISSSVMGASDVEVANPMGSVDFMTAAANSGEISTWTYQGDQGFTRSSFATNMPGIRSLSNQGFTHPNNYWIFGAAHESGEIAQWWSSSGYAKQTIGFYPGVMACGAAQLNIETDSLHDVYFCTDEGFFGWWEMATDELHEISSAIESPRDVAAARIGDDPRNDLLLASGHEISWWRNTQNRFYCNVICDNLPQASVVRGLDADGDGDTDVLCAGDNEIRLYLSTLNDEAHNSALAKQPEPDDNRISSLPDKFELFANYPNPFNASTNIRFAMPEAGAAKILIFDITGRLVTTLANGNFAAGYHTLTFDASALSSGVYFYRLETGDLALTRKMVLLK